MLYFKAGHVKRANHAAHNDSAVDSLAQYILQLDAPVRGTMLCKQERISWIDVEEQQLYHSNFRDYQFRKVSHNVLFISNPIQF